MFDSVYIHVPFCRHRCGYCNFTLIAGRDDLIDRYLEALSLELDRVEIGTRLTTLFLGGGTPTHLSGTQLTSLFDLLHQRFHISDETEFSVEANPIDIDVDVCNRLRDAGVNRISLGAQSWDDEKLKRLERDHRGTTVDQACEYLRQAEMPSISIDLIFGAPGETREIWERDLDHCLAIEPNHVSTYGLTYEKGTQFWTRQHKQQLQPIAEDDELWMFETAIDRLSASGWEHYEVSNFARKGHRCRHNEAYWTGREFEAFGPGAARYLGGERSVNHRSTTTYLNRVLAGNSPLAESETLSNEERARERFVFGMRRLEGVELTELSRELNIDVAQLLHSEIEECVQSGWMRRDGARIQLTRQGLMLSDSLWPKMI